jgi:pyridoxamine 5'-phosphate oxidase
VTDEDFAQLSEAIAHLGRTQIATELDLSDLDPDPIVQFAQWMKDAIEAEIELPNAMTLATAGADGRPSARMVLLKEFDERGFVFYSNYYSRKGRDLSANPHAAMVFYWSVLQRQVTLAGAVEKLDQAESESYFSTRPIGSKLAAWASRQSEDVESRDALLERLGEAERRFADQDVPLPDYWGGYRLVPEAMEFWLSRPNRMHDRFRYVRSPGGGWERARLYP